MSFSLGLAQRANAISFDTCPPEAVALATRALADTLGVMVAGSAASFLDPIARVLGADGRHGTVCAIGRPGRYSILHAALLNGTSAHALDYDDCSTVMGAHPSAPVVPAILALAQERGLDGRAVVESYLTGIEVEIRLARAVMPHHYEKGWHPTSTLGVFGAAAAAARLLRFDDGLLAHALAVSVSLASGVKANFGTPVKPLHVGQAAYNGLLAAITVSQGMRANLDAFEHNYGFFNLFNGAAAFDPQHALEGWDEGLEILGSGLSVKQHPCCGSAHSAIDAALEIHAAKGVITPERIERIDIWSHPRRLAHTDRPAPRTGLDAKFSTQFLTAKALQTGAIGLGDFDDLSFLTPDVASLMEKTAVHRRSGADEYLGELRVTLCDGTRLDAQASTALGRGPDRPLSDAEREAKFIDCLRGRADAQQARDLFEMILALDTAQDVSAIIDGISR